MTTQRVKIPTDIIHLIRRKTPLCLKCRKKTKRWEFVKHCLLNGVRGFKHFPNCEDPDFNVPNWFTKQKEVKMVITTRTLKKVPDTSKPVDPDKKDK